jgi:hypothetical protein
MILRQAQYKSQGRRFADLVVLASVDRGADFRLDGRTLNSVLIHSTRPGAVADGSARATREWRASWRAARSNGIAEPFLVRLRSCPRCFDSTRAHIASLAR